MHIATMNRQLAIELHRLAPGTSLKDFPRKLLDTLLYKSFVELKTISILDGVALDNTSLKAKDAIKRYNLKMIFLCKAIIYERIFNN